ncbi:MAG: glycoside hydrolase domain-containing protein [Lachnospiraceae bacterium]
MKKRILKAGLSLVLVFSMVMHPSLMSAQAADASGRVSYYSFDNVTGTALEDEWGDRDGVISGSIAEGKVGNALNVTEAGVGAVITENFDDLDTDWTVCCWVNTSADFTGEISVTEDAEQKYSSSLKLAAGRASGFRVGDNSGDVLTFAYDFNAGSWYHIAWSQDKDSGLSFYVNGSLVGKNTWPVTHTVKAPIGIIGGTGFTGLIDEVKVYNAALTVEEVNEAMRESTGEETADTVKTRIPHTQTTGDGNYFTFSETGWTAMGNSNEHVWSDAPGDYISADVIWYEVKFVGHAIDVYAGKNRPMGFVKYYLDGDDMGEYSLYNNGNINSAYITTFDGLEEGEHTLRAVATGKRDTNSTNSLIDCAEVYVYHAPYKAESITVAESAVTLAAGATMQMSYSVRPSYAELSDVVFASSDDTVAAVNDRGEIRALKEGSVDITVSSESAGLSAVMKVTVQPAVADINGSIVDTDTQWTEDRYDEVKNAGKLSASLTAWKNDRAVSEIALVSVDSSLKNVTVTASDLENGSDVISAENVTATFIRSAKAYNGNYLGYGSTTRPVPEDNGTNRSESSDILYQTTPIDIPFNNVQPVWVEFDIPADAAAGTYTGTLSVTADGIEEALEFTYEIRVQDALLPDPSEFTDTFDIMLWQYPYSSAEYYDVEPFSEEHFAILESGMEIYKEVGGNAITATILEEAWSGQTYSANDIHYPSMVKWTKNADGSFSYDYSDFDAWVGFCKEMGLGDKIVLYSIAPWHGSFNYWEGDQLKYEKYTVGSTRYTEVWTDFFENLIDHLEEKGWFDSAYVGIDERGFDSRAFDLIESITNDEGVCLKTASDMDNFVNKWDMALRITDLNVGDTAAAANPQKFAELAEVREAKGYRTTLYSCTEHQPGQFSLSAPVESYWAVLNAGMMGADGFNRWAFDAWVADPLNDTTHNAFEAGDCFLIFPDEKDAENPTSKYSVRLARMAEGVRDVNKLALMAEKIPALGSDVEEAYRNIRYTLTTSRSVLSDAGVAALRNETAAFKQDLEEITDKYIELKENGTETVESVVISEGSKASVRMGNTLQLHAAVLPENLVNNQVTWKSSDEAVLTVSSKGIVTPVSEGTAVITAASVLDESKKAEITVTVKEKLQIRYTIPQFELDDKYITDIDKPDTSTGQNLYLGQPDMVRTSTGRLITAYPQGHGKGPIIMQISDDNGETWTKKTDTPASWAGSQETPTMYILNLEDGTERIMMITACPGWGTDSDGNRYGWNTSYSDDNGETWTEYQHFYSKRSDGSNNDVIVAMASLIQLKDDEGNDIQKWMGVYHNYSYVNYKTYLTFDEDGNEQWSDPVPYLSEYRDVESTYQICEVGMFRSPDGSRIVGLGRSQSHQHKSVMICSDDEGETWCRPIELQGALQGERHKAVYDPVSGRLAVTFREITLDYNKDGVIAPGDWKAGEWILWVGTYEDLMEQNEGEYRILLEEDWANNTYSGDTGYAGIVVLEDGTFIMDSYGHWDKEFSQSWPGGVTTDLCYIKQAKFKLTDVENDNDYENYYKNALLDVIAEAEDLRESDYTAESWSVLKKALNEARAGAENEGLTNTEAKELCKALEGAMSGLVSGAEDDSRDYPTDQLTAISASQYLPGTANEGPDDYILDGKANTHWHTDWNTTEGMSVENRWIGVSLKEASMIDGIRYLPRTTGGSNGAVTEYKVQYRETDDGEWIDLASGTWDRTDSAWKLVSFDPVMAKQIRVVGVHTWADSGTDAHMSTAELRVRVKQEERPESIFTDVKEEDFFFQAVLWAVDNRITDGWTDTEFTPHMTCTRGQAVTFLWRANGCPEMNTESGFRDVPADAYYAKAVAWAAAEKITDGWTDTEFAPDRTVTRAQVVTFLWRANGCENAEANVEFSDVPEDVYYADAVAWAVENEITNSWTETEFAPDIDCTRGQIVTFLYRAK